jgi:hypothetical protein
MAVPMVALTAARRTARKVRMVRDLLTAGQWPVHTMVVPTAARRAQRTAVLLLV